MKDQARLTRENRAPRRPGWLHLEWSIGEPLLVFALFRK